MLLRNIVDRLDKCIGTIDDEAVVFLIFVPMLVLAFASIAGFMTSMGHYNHDLDAMVGATPFPIGYVMLFTTIVTLGMYGIASLCGGHKYWLIPLSMQLALYGGIYGLSLLTNLSWVVYVIFAVATVVVAELIYWADPQKPSGVDSHYWFAAKVKLECYMDVAFGWLVAGSVIGVIYATMISGEAFVKGATDALMTYGIYPLAVIGVIVAIWGYIYLNSLKFRKIPKEEPKAEETTVPNNYVKCPSCGQLNNRTQRTNCYYCSAPLPEKDEEET